MSKNSPKIIRKPPSGYSNPLFTDIFQYGNKDEEKSKMVSKYIEESSSNSTYSSINSIYPKVSYKERADEKFEVIEDDCTPRYTNSPCRLPPLENLSLADRNCPFKATKRVSCPKQRSFSIPKAQSTTLGSKFYEQDSEKNVPLSSLSWSSTYVKPFSKKSTSTCFPSPLKFSSRGLSTQNSNFTPLMYRRAISLRGHSVMKNEEGPKGSKATCNGTLRTILRRSCSEKINTVNNIAVEEDDWEASHHQLTRRAAKTKRILKVNPSESASINDDMMNSGNVTELVTNNICNRKKVFRSSEAFSNDLIFLKKNLEEYILSLNELLDIYEKMKVLSPEKIRQHFDLPLRIIGKIFNFQCYINKVVKESNGNLTCMAKAFLCDQLIAYQQYMILSPTIFSDFHNFKDHFDLNFPTFKSLILLPSSKLNFYIQTLTSFLKFASPSEKNELNRAISYLRDLKWNANTEMTIKIVKDSPVDLHLGGRILNVGELTYTNGPLPKRTYYLIAFENMLVITISKVSFCLYVTHFRSEQIICVGCEKSSELIITTASCNHENQEVHQFRSSEKSVDKWFSLIDDWIVDKMASYEIVSDSYSCPSKSVSGNNYPLSLWQVFPFLKKSVVTSAVLPDINSFKNIKQLCSLLIEVEAEYIEKLNNIFNPQTLPPPPELKDLLQRILNLHEIYFLPELRQTVKKDITLAVDIFMNYLLKFNTYKTYLIKRCLCTVHMPDGIRAQYYIAPVQHFAFYLEWSKELGLIDRYSQASAFAVDTLLNFIMDAKVILLHETIPNSCLDFYKTGELRKGGQMEIKARPRQKNIKDGSYLVLLFEKVLLFLKPKSPTYHLVFDLWLYQANFGPPPGNPNTFRLEFRQGKCKSHINFDFKTLSPCLKQEWVDQIKEELQVQAEEIKKCSFLKTEL
ncbi:hypothetical protein Avbf_09374 [Armadillidium vulgare]|nr:hypothetical protein Avbf_09374 [Armadillidium vulgare]